MGCTSSSSAATAEDVRRVQTVVGQKVYSGGTFRPGITSKLPQVTREISQLRRGQVPISVTIDTDALIKDEDDGGLFVYDSAASCHDDDCVDIRHPLPPDMRSTVKKVHELNQFLLSVKKHPESFEGSVLNGRRLRDGASATEELAAKTETSATVPSPLKKKKASESAAPEPRILHMRL
mmetsp:Transcript_22731/g.53044  ORF Transcript_22731/g.53044 Transcript_22731/m.53044 type:complete len:179 (-) Transcript_22731:78-614(-)